MKQGFYSKTDIIIRNKRLKIKSFADKNFTTMLERGVLVTKLSETTDQMVNARNVKSHIITFRMKTLTQGLSKNP
jgi:hypothetical protein